MTVFAAYAEYYDMLYRDKNYAAEARYVAGILNRFFPGAASILDLGCGTGAHDVVFADAGYRVVGVDRSAESIKRARVKVQDRPGASLRFETGDIQDVRLEERFDAVVSLFHVLSYLTTEDALARALGTARHHLVEGGVLLFDYWYGPGVLADPPGVRIKRVENDDVELVRIAEPELITAENIVNVNYQVLARHKTSARLSNIHERHTMRYWFKPEIDRLLSANGFEPVAFIEWMCGDEPGPRTWNACSVARKVPGWGHR